MKIKVGVLGATGSVGQRFILLLQDHPYFELAEVAASLNSAGKQYIDAANWVMEEPIPDFVKSMIVKECIPELDCSIVFSGLDSSVAGEVEVKFAERGYIVVSNAKNHRMDSDVPLLIPEINPEHLNQIKNQKYRNGCIITNPNCSTAGLAVGLKPLYDRFGIESLHVVTMQAISGAGYPGVSSLDILGNIIPHIGGEEEKKVETEPLKILGSYNELSDKLVYADFPIVAQCNRVPVLNGHTESVLIKLKKKCSVQDLIDAWNNAENLPLNLGLPSACKKLIYYFKEEKYPQPRLHANLENGMSVSIGHMRQIEPQTFQFVLLSHNTIRGAAGAAVLNAELLYKLNPLKYMFHSV